MNGKKIMYIGMKHVTSALEQSGEKTYNLGQVKLISNVDAADAGKNHRQSTLHYLHSLKILIYAYVLACIMQERPWCTLAPLYDHYALVEKNLRTDMALGDGSKFMLIGCEKQARRHWHDMSLTENCYMDIIRASADKLRSSWPIMHDVAAQNRGKKRGGEGSAGPVKKRRYENEKT